MRKFFLAAVLLLTASAHAQWTMQDSRTTADLRGIDNVGGGVAWASGTHGTVLRTEDAGFAWQVCAVPPGAEKLDFRGVQGFDANTAIVMSSGPGDLSRLYKTTDGCQTWTLVFTNPDKDGFWDAVKFDQLGLASSNGQPVKDGNGLLLGDPLDGKFSVFDTHDTGGTWTKWVAHKRARNEPDCASDSFMAKPQESVFAASNETLLASLIFVTGGPHPRMAYVDHSDLDGLFCHDSTKWMNLPIGDGSQSSGAFAIAVKKSHDRVNPRLQLMIVGGDYAHPDQVGRNSLFISSFDAAGSPLALSVLVRKPTTPVHGYRSAVAYDQTSNAWITVGPNGTDVSFDDGRNWRALKPGAQDAIGADRDWNALSLPFVVGPQGRIGVLRDAALVEARAAAK